MNNYIFTHIYKFTYNIQFYAGPTPPKNNYNLPLLQFIFIFALHATSAGIFLIVIYFEAGVNTQGYVTLFTNKRCP